ncbi:putative AIM2 family protein C30D10.14 [Pseudolycoriella hygida]|uniref:AIM2 family protein C30D10.14 n=1 Tax=Pseudolycoriella hygida TaxID=35572 RepID=A0A9Q0MW69_9DIPT|nr:putative AIM2 family protein C30D10.14 [Pseudolycoriella hygida]
MILINYLILFVISTSCAKTCNAVFVPHECIKNRAIAANYTPRGHVLYIGNLPVYEFEDENNQRTNRLLLGVYDIYGFAYQNLKQVIDEMAVQSGGFKVILPDFFRGESTNPEFNATERQQWLQRVGDWDSIVRPDLLSILEYYKTKGVMEFGIFGFCWGGKVATLTATHLSEEFKAAGIVHPSAVTNEEAVGVNIPMYLMPTRNDLDMMPFYEVLQAKFGSNCGHRRFDDMIHGFAGARGNFSDPLVQQRVNEVISTLGAFFDRNLNNSTNFAPNILHIFLVTITSFWVLG